MYFFTLNLGCQVNGVIYCLIAELGLANSSCTYDLACIGFQSQTSFIRTEKRLYISLCKFWVLVPVNGYPSSSHKSSRALRPFRPYPLEPPDIVFLTSS